MSTQGVEATTHPKIRSRFAADARGGFRLERRDVDLLTDLYLHQAMTRGQIMSLGYFTSVSRCNRVLRRLFDRHYLERHFVPEAPYGAQTIYTKPGKSAASVLAPLVDQATAEIISQCRRGAPTFLSHCLAIVDARIAFIEAARESDSVTVERWLPECSCRDEYQVRHSGGDENSWRTEVFRPDGYVCLHRDGLETAKHFFLEIDLGHTNSKQLIGKLRTHEHYLQTGLFSEKYGCGPEDNFKTLVVTTGSGRLKNLCDLVEQHSSGLFWFTTFEAARFQGALSRIWRAPRTDELQSLL